MKSSKVFWGVFLIAGAIFGLAAQMGFVQGVGGWAIFGTMLFAALFVKSVMNRGFYGMFFSLAFIAIIYSEQLGIQAITPWPLLGAAFCLGLGCKLLFPQKKNWKKYVKNAVKNHVNVNVNEDSDGNIVIDKDGKEIRVGESENGVNINIHENGGAGKTVYVNGEEINMEDGCSEDETVFKDGGEWVNMTQVFKSTSKYVNSDHFAGLNGECVFCKADIYFDNAVMSGNTASINLDSVFSTTTLYVPKTWTVKDHVESVFASYSEVGRKEPDGVHTLILNCDNVFGSLKIFYV